MKLISNSKILICIVLFSTSLHATGDDAIILLLLGAPQAEARGNQDTSDDRLTRGVGDSLRVTIRNTSDFDLVLPAADSACALVGVERSLTGAWQKWSDCERRRRIDNPIVLAPGQVIEEVRRFQRRPSESTSEDSENPPNSAAQLPAEGTGEVTRPPDSKMYEQEVQQSTVAAPPVPFFERFRLLPAGEYRLTASYAFLNRPEEIRQVRSRPFLIVEKRHCHPD